MNRGTGPTDFTRKAGAAGMLAVPVTVALALPAQRDLVGVALVTSLAMTAVFLLGLVVRHRRYVWARPVAALAIFSVALGVFGGLGTIAAIGFQVASMGLLLGVLVTGELPRRPTLLLLLAPVFRDEEGLELVRFALSAIGFTWLGFAMWREPLPTRKRSAGTAHGSPEPV